MLSSEIANFFSYRKKGRKMRRKVVIFILKFEIDSVLFQIQLKHQSQYFFLCVGLSILFNECNNGYSFPHLISTFFQC